MHHDLLLLNQIFVIFSYIKKTKISKIQKELKLKMFLNTTF